MLRLLKVSRLCPEVTNWVNEDRCQCISVQLDGFLLIVSQGIVPIRKLQPCNMVVTTLLHGCYNLVTL